MVELRCWIEAFFQIEFLLEMESHWRLEYTCNLKVTGSKEDLVELPFLLNSWIPLPLILPNHYSVGSEVSWFVFDCPILHEESEFLAQIAGSIVTSEELWLSKF